MTNIGREALIPNPTLTPFGVFLGTWKTEGAHALLPGVTLHGHTSFEWAEGGAFLLMRSEIEEPGIPSGVATIGSDDVLQKCFMLYFDERGVSRMYTVSMQANTLTWWRDAPGFSQRFTLTLADGGKTMTAVSELSKDGSTWERDLELTYIRLE